jgi:acetyltransferase-like isoleucine patch superfamily enzyme
MAVNFAGFSDQGRDYDRGSDAVMPKTILRNIAKDIAQAMAFLSVLPFAILTGFGRLAWIFQTVGQFFSLMPGLPGEYLRVAYYVLTLRRCSIDSRVSIGSFFAHSSATVGKDVYIGAYCVLGFCEIGERTQIASHVQILSGKHQHSRESDGRIMGANKEEFSLVTIGADCWIGAAAIIMADIGHGTTIGAGAVVTRTIPANVVAVGNPARVLDRNSG